MASQVQEQKATGKVSRVSGPVVTADGLTSRMYDVVFVGEENLMGEVIEIQGDKTLVQVYEETSGLRPGEPVRETHRPLSVELGPGLLRAIYDGIQRPLEVLKDKMGDFISRGVSAPGLDHAAKWEFDAIIKRGADVAPGTILGTVEETPSIQHKVLLPPGVKGQIAELNSGKFTVDDIIGQMEDGTPLRLAHQWPVRRGRPFIKKLPPTVPLVTGMRILDGLFPVAKGGTAAIPGPFGSGKTVTQQSLAKWSDADIVVYIGCGERGNEMTEVLTEFPHLEDPKTGNPLMDRTVLIANTSNMPVAAREASVYTGITLAEYYRDQGYDVALMADSTSRWAEAMREISSRLEEMPGEEGYPAYLAARLAEFYERAGRVNTLNKDEGSVTVIGAVSPPGGDFSEPVTQNTLRIVKVFWALDAKLAQRRHFPAINWLDSYSLYQETLGEWFETEVSDQWDGLRSRAMDVLQQEAELQDIVQLVGSDALPPDQQLTLEVARMYREIFLQQNAFHNIDAFSPPQKQFTLLQAIDNFRSHAVTAMEKGVELAQIQELPFKTEIAKARFEEDFDGQLDKATAAMKDTFKEWGVQ